MNHSPVLASDKVVSSYQTVSWLAEPPPVKRSLLSRSGVGAVIQAGHALRFEYQEAAVPALDNDVFILFGHGHNVRARVGDDAMQFAPGHFAAMIYAAGLPSKWSCSPSHSPVIHLHIPPDFRVSHSEKFEAEGTRANPVAFGDRLWRIGELLRDSLLSSNPISSLALDAFAALAVENWAGYPHAKSRGEGLAPWQVNRIVDLLQSDLAHDFTLQTLASEVRLSSFHFARSFKQATGLPPHRFLIQLRIEKAKELLEHTALSITEIAAHIGYDDPGYFSRLFLKEVGVAPSRYRREQRA
jgi:AraC-like DNA-binding protein